MNQRAKDGIKQFLEALSVDTEAPELEKTPSRVTELYSELFSGVGLDTKSAWGETFSTDYKGLVAVTGIPFYSMCEHHLVPFFGEVQIAYLPRNGKVAGFGKFTKIVDILAHQPQLQERLTKQIASAIEEDLGAEGVMVVISAQQLCMMIRGELSLGTRTVTAESRGKLRGDGGLPQQAWQLLMEEK